MKVGDELELKLTDLSRGGAAVAREASGQVVFVPFGAPGDRVLARVVAVEKRYVQAELKRVLEPSPVRVEPRCAVFGRCGGCEWQHLSSEVQWQTKVRGMRHALARVGIAVPPAFFEFPAESAWGYRNRVQLRGFQEKIGFFAARSHDLVPIESCPVARLEINEKILQVREEGRRWPRPYKVEVEVTESGEVGVVWNAPHAAAGFRQVNDAQNEKLRAWIAEQLTAGRVLFDFFGGNGNLSLPLASKMTEIHCVDLSCPKEAPPGAPPHFYFHRAFVLSWLLRRAGGNKKSGFQESKENSVSSGIISSAIFDPPRMGLGDHFMAISTALGKLQVTEIIAVGCDLDAWARDVCRWVSAGWGFEAAAVFDFFPQTHHVESVALLRKWKS